MRSTPVDLAVLAVGHSVLLAHKVLLALQEIKAQLDHKAIKDQPA
jgi:hypothetical protein